MNQQDRELVCQYLDEEMGVAERNHFEQRLAAEAELRDTLQSYRAVDSHLRRAMAREGHVPVTVAALLAGSDDRVAVLPARRRQTWGLAVAASLLAGVVIINGPQWLADSRDNLLVPNIQESVAFSQILEESPSRAKGWLPVADDVAMRPGTEFCQQWRYLVSGIPGRTGPGSLARRRLSARSRLGCGTTGTDPRSGRRKYRLPYRECRNRRPGCQLHRHPLR